jgi:RNA polymerase sigma-70 factor (ECF subfamily)
MPVTGSPGRWETPAAVQRLKCRLGGGFGAPTALDAPLVDAHSRPHCGTGPAGGWDSTGPGRRLRYMDSLAPDLAIAATVERAAAGDEIAFARIVATHRAEMVRVAYVVSSDWELAQDATQAALWNAWRKLPSLRDPASLRPWLMSVAANEARTIARRERRHPVVELAMATDAAGSAQPADEIDQIDLGNALRRLTPDDRALVALRYVASLDSAEIGTLTGRSASGVRTRLARLLDRLQKDLDHD